MRTLLGLLVVFVLPVGFAFGFADEETKPKHTIKDVMNTAHKKGLLKKVVDGKASDEEKIQLLDLYVSLKENHPPQGDEESWRDKTDFLVITAAKVVTGREGSAADLKKVATSCAACHKEHKPK